MDMYGKDPAIYEVYVYSEGDNAMFERKAFTGQEAIEIVRAELFLADDPRATCSMGARVKREG